MCSVFILMNDHTCSWSQHCRLLGEKGLIFCARLKCFFMIIVNISLKKMDELRDEKYSLQFELPLVLN